MHGSFLRLIPIDMGIHFFFFFQAEDGIRDYKVTGVQTCALPICLRAAAHEPAEVDQLDRAIETAKEIADAAKERGVNAEDMKTKDAKDAKATKKGKIGRASCRERV